MRKALVAVLFLLQGVGSHAQAPIDLQAGHGLPSAPMPQRTPDQTASPSLPLNRQEPSAQVVPATGMTLSLKQAEAL